MTITGAAPTHYDSNFACCGGCSSSKRGDAYNEKLATGSLVFIWDIKLKTDPQSVCSLTFPYDPALNEQVGERRVRSGRLVGTSYPIDNDYDHLCCEQRGSCLALNEDASGKCHCVKRWGFTGDHCQNSVYDVAEVANDEVFPNATNLSSVDHLLPDLRSYLLSFDYDSAISSAAAANTSSEFQSVLEMGSYRQFGWATTAFFLLAAAFFMLVFIGHAMWKFCFFKCGCRRRNPLAQPKIYSSLQKLGWGTVMMVFMLISTAAALMTFFVVLSDIKPLAESALVLLNETLPSNLTTFELNFLSPLDELLASGYRDDNGHSFFLSTIQEHSVTDLESHVFLDKQSYAKDLIGQPIFDLLDPLTGNSLLYPTANNDSVDCENMNITLPSVMSRMTIGGETGCFKCKTCLAMVHLIEEAKTSWRMHIFEVQIDMLAAKDDLRNFSLSSSTLTPSIQAFLDRMHLMCSDFRAVNGRLAAAYDTISGEMQQFSLLGLYALCGLCGSSIILGASAFAHGIRTGKRKIGRAACFFTEIAFLVALILTGVLYTMSVMIQDGIVVLQRFEQNTLVFFPSALSAEDVNRLLFDHNFVEAIQMTETVAFSDTLRVPPHPTPTNDDPDRFDFAELYDMPALFALEQLTAQSDKALVELFAWNETFVTDHYEDLKVLALVDADVATPYNESLHQNLLNSTVQQLMDPDRDGVLVTANDFVTIQTTFNKSWRGVSDQGLELNRQIQQRWLFVAQLYYQRQKLEAYVATVSRVIAKIHPPLNDLILKTKAMEDAEFQLKAPVEFVIDSIRASKIADCNYNGNCAWLRSALNELFGLFQQMALKAERAVVSCTVSVVALLLSVLCTDAFTSRMRRNVVKVYTSG
ncbi:hypothetical protein PHYPSEUDO_004569 [Phytophthora pseudosyringae]|uniref:EGF-like domain-containing protein n=1 Tax=Phytophthora pseudosyringae TaxID=221518 RepID=A0A8T1WIJ0_9STRA|nr:hypothetical protein PHYPSEUDO_004569 [Phytophthora pseudosyringae]